MGFGLLVFVVTTVAVTVVMILFAFYITTGPCVSQGPSDPCDGPAILFVAILASSPIIGAAAGIFSGLVGWYYVRMGSSFHAEIPTIK